MVDRERTIRLLEILPRTSPDEPIELRLLNDISLTRPKDRTEEGIAHSRRERHSSSNGYSAISYEWGDPKATTYIISINSKAFEVRQNLYDLLARLAERTDLSRKSFWIDAICIDQGNLAEKNSQVQQMKRIFRNADVVFAWLGEAMDDSDGVADFINSYEETPALEHFDGSTESQTRINTISDRIVSYNMKLEAMAKPLSALYRRSYFRRLWVVQELVLASTVTVLCGSKAWSWNAWWSLFRGHQIGRPRADDRGQVNDEFNAQDLEVTRATRRKEGGAGFSLCELILTYKNFRCCEPRDKVFALLGIASEGRDLAVDYSQPLEVILLASLVRCLSIPITCGIIEELRVAVGLSRASLHVDGKIASNLTTLYTRSSILAYTPSIDLIEMLSLSEQDSAFNKWNSIRRTAFVLSRGGASNDRIEFSCMCLRCMGANNLRRRPITFQDTSRHVHRLTGRLAHERLSAEDDGDMTLVFKDDLYVETLLSYQLWEHAGKYTYWLSFYDRLIAAGPNKPNAEGDLEMKMSIAVILNFLAHRALLQQLAGKPDFPGAR